MCDTDSLKYNNIQEIYPLTVEALSITLGKLWVISTHGLMRTAPAGIGKPMSLMTVSAVTQSAAPAESPAKTSFDAGTGLWPASGGGFIK